MSHWMTALLLLGGVVGFTGCSFVPELESPIVCEGNFHYHLQDVCVNDKGELFWTFTDTLAKTDSRGNLIATCSTEEEYAHLGGIVAKDGKLYVAVGFVRDWSIGSEKAEIFVYDEDTLELIERYPINETKSIDGITTTPNGFFVAGDRIDKGPNVEIFEFEGTVYRSALYGADFSRVRRQLEGIAPFVEKVLIYQYPGLMSKPGSKAFTPNSAAEKLYDEYVKYLQGI